MKNKLKILIVLIFISSKLTAQNAFYDAQFFNQIEEEAFESVLFFDSQKLIQLSAKEKNQIDNAIEFYNKPFKPCSTKLDVKFVKTAIDKYNKYIEEYGARPTSGFSSFSGTTGIFDIIPGLLSGEFSSDGDIQTKVLDALVKYVAEEFKKAQLITYMETFEATIGEIGELEILFPNTYKKLKTIDPTKFPELGDEFKEIFNKDLKLIIDNLTHHIDTHDNTKPIDLRLKLLNAANVTTIKSSGYYESLKLSADLSNKLINNYHPVDLFNYLDFTYYKESMLLGTTSSRKLHENLGIIIHGINLFQSNLIDIKKDAKEVAKSTWINFEQLKQLNSDTEWKYFAGLIYQSDTAFFDEIFGAPTSNTITAAQLKKIKLTFNALLSSLVEIRDFRASLSEKNIEDNYIEYMNILINVISQVNVNNVDLNTYLELTDNVLSIYDNARKKDYDNSMHYTFLVLEQLFGSNTGYQNVVNKLNKYSSFAADVINSKDSDDAKELIKKHVAPAASFINKREFTSTLSITTQPGYYIGFESLDGYGGFTSGITLPVGFELTWKLTGKKASDKKPENKPSIGVFAQLLDLGAMLNFRVSDESSTLPDKVEISQVFSPGASITYGLKNSPLTIGLGYQYTSELRKITLDNGNEIYPNGHRVFLRLGWDIPLINISKSKNKSKKIKTY